MLQIRCLTKFWITLWMRNRKVCTFPNFVDIHTFFYKQRFFSTQPQCCLTFSWTGLQMWLRWCLIPITIITMRHILYLVYLRPCLCLFLPCRCDLFFIFTLILIAVNHITSFQQTNLFFIHYLEYLLLFWEENIDVKVNNFHIAKV